MRDGEDIHAPLKELLGYGDKDVSNELKTNYFMTVKYLLMAIYNLYPKLLEHTYRVALTSKRIAEKVECDAHCMQTIVLGSLLHDMGVLGVSINYAIGKTWSEKELQVYYPHTVIGKSIIEPIRHFKCTLPIIEQHHEYLNGMGHPRGMKEDEIPFEVRVVTDMLSEEFPWGKRYPLFKRIDEIKRGSKTLYDPWVVDAFLELCNK
jgi:response regulator RpfG family c-di-GMP phosphodiesterase